MFHNNQVSFTRFYHRLNKEYIDKSPLECLIKDIKHYKPMVNYILKLLNDVQIIDNESVRIITQLNREPFPAIVLEELLLTIPNEYYDDVIKHITVSCKLSDGCKSRLDETVNRCKTLPHTSIFNLIDVLDLSYQQRNELIATVNNPLAKVLIPLFTLSTVPLRNQLQDPNHVGRLTCRNTVGYYHAIGNDAERICTQAISNIINELKLNINIESNTSCKRRRLACGDIRLTTNNHIIIIEVKNTFHLVVEGFDETTYANGPYPNGDINKFERDVKFACINHSRKQVHGLLLSINSNACLDLPNHGVLRQNEVLKVPRSVIPGTSNGYCGEAVNLDPDKTYTLDALYGRQCNEREIAIYILKILADEPYLLSETLNANV